VAVPDTVTLKVEGLRTINAALRDLPQAVQQKVLAAALNAGGEVLRKGIAEKIHNRTGKTSADLRTEIQLKDNDLAGVVAVGASSGKQGRSFILRFLERGTKPHAEPKKRRRRSTPAKPMTVGGKVFSRVQHPGTSAQAPMRETIAAQGEEAVAAFSRVAWAGIRAVVEKASD
jgi:HK97 gp10 family phage protein